MAAAATGDEEPVVVVVRIFFDTVDFVGRIVSEDVAERVVARDRFVHGRRRRILNIEPVDVGRRRGVPR